MISFKKIKYKKLFKKPSNVLMKGITLVIAISLWFFVTNSKKAVRNFNIPYNVNNIPEYLTVANFDELPKNVAVSIKGAKEIVENISFRDLRAYININSPVKGKYTNMVEIDRKHLPKGISKIDIRPESFKIEIEEIDMKEVVIIPITDNEPADGYKVKTASVKPVKITIKGAKSTLEDLVVLKTKTINIEGITGSLYRDVFLDYDKRIINIVDGIETVRVSIEVEKNFIKRSFNKITIKAMGINKNLKLKMFQPETASIVLNGPPIMMKKMIAKNILIYVDCKNIVKKGKYKKDLYIKYPRGSSLISLEPREANVILEVK